MASFNFGASSTSGGSSQSLFGTTNQPASSAGGLFGNTATSGTNSAGFSFGGFNPPTSNASSQQSLFGATSSMENKAPPSNIFGKGSGIGIASSGGPNGSKEEDNQSSDTTKPAFPGFGTPDKISTPSTSAPALFGSTTPATSGSGNLFSFGNASTTPAGPPPSSSTFSASTGGAGLFGSKPAEDAGKKQNFSFGKPTETPAGGSTASGNLFGSKPASGGFSFGKPAESTSTSASGVNAPSAAEQKPTFSFGQPASSQATSTAASQPVSATSSTLFGEAPRAPPTQGQFSKPAATEAGASAPKPTFSFGQTAPQASGSATPATSAPAQKPLFGGLGGSTTSAASSAAGTAATTAAASPFSFGPPTTSSASQPSTTSAPAASPFSFGGAATAPASQPATTTSTAAPTTGSSTAPFAVPGTSGAPTSTTGPVPPAQSRLRNKTMDEILTRWATDMSRYSKEFKEQAETIARWDQLIVDNSSKIDKLYVRTRTCERQTMSVDMQLSAVENSQSELESWLTKYENDVDEMLAKDSANPSEMGGPDQERERTYKLAEKLGEKLEVMERDLASMVEEVNAANASLNKNGKGDEPITQIVKILNSHLIQLQAIDQGTVALQEKVAAAQKSASNLGYLNGYGSSNGGNGAAVQDFYRSYLGRR